MENSNDGYWGKIKNLGIFSMGFPLIILIAGILLAKKGLPALVENYEQGMIRIIQYILFAIGVLIFFFCDGISDFFAHRLFAAGKQREQENLSSYFAYVFIIMWMLNMISVAGFIGFLICRNLTWLTVFVILTLSIQMKYFPSEGRFKRLLELGKK
jgi:hypothetical protein